MSLHTVNPPSRFDQAWKKILDDYFQEFMEFFYPKLAENIDWDKGYQFMDKELEALTSDGMIGKKFVDKLVKVHSKGGQASFVLLHTELQGDKEDDFPERLYIYHYRLRDRYKLPILTLAILADDNKSWRPSFYKDEVWNETILVFHFFINKLLDYRDKKPTLLDTDNPFGMVVASHLNALKTRSNPETRYQQKMKLTRCLYEKGWGRDAILKLYYFMDAAMTLPAGLEIQYNEFIHVLEEEKKVDYITSAERIGREKGRQEGLEKGRQEGLEKGRQEGLEKGRQEGLEKGEHKATLEMLRFSLQAKFPDASLNPYESEIAEAKKDRLFEWIMRAMNAQTLSEVFGH